MVTGQGHVTRMWHGSGSESARESRRELLSISVDTVIIHFSENSVDTIVFYNSCPIFSLVEHFFSMGVLLLLVAPGTGKALLGSQLLSNLPAERANFFSAGDEIR
jgi:hypothetical protein